MSIVDQLIASYGYVALAGVVGGESMGLPLPGESVLIAAGAYAGATHRLSVWLVVVVAAAAAVIGDNVGFWAGRRFGPRLLRYSGRRWGRVSRRLPAVLGLYGRHGASIVVVGRYISVVRTYAAFGAGASGMPAGRFAALNAVGGLSWAAVFGFGSGALGATVGTTVTYMVAGLALTVAAAVALVWTRRARGRTEPPPSPPAGPGVPRPLRDVELAGQRR